MLAAAMGDFDILKLLYDAENKKIFRKGDRFCDLRRQRVKFMRAWRSATSKPLHTIASIKERRSAAAILIQDMVRSAMEFRGIWQLPTPFGRILEVTQTKFGDRMKIEYEDEAKTQEENFLLEFQHLELLVRGSFMDCLFLCCSHVRNAAARCVSFLVYALCRLNGANRRAWT